MKVQNPSDRGDTASAKHMVATSSKSKANELLAPRSEDGRNTKNHTLRVCGA